MTNLENLPLWGNNLTGPIPPELGRLSNLDVLTLYNNNLTGPIPPELGDLTNLTYLWVTNNNLTGPLPSSMTNLGRLEYLGIENNAGLCAPADAAFQAWLATVKDFRGETCAQEVPTVPLLAQMFLALLLLCGGAYYPRAAGAPLGAVGAEGHRAGRIPTRIAEGSPRAGVFANRKVARWSNTYTTAVEGDLSDADDIVVTVRRSKNNPAGCHRSPNNPHLWSLAPLTPMCAC